MIRSYSVEEDGYHPLIIRDGWQLAQLNYTVEQHINNIVRLDMHLKTDEFFALVKGNAILIVASIFNGEPVFEIELMRPGTMYNIPKNVWHNIAMEEGSEVWIAEKANTHVSDFEHWELGKDKKEELQSMVDALFDSAKA